MFFGLAYVHLMLMLAPASRGGEAAVATWPWHGDLRFTPRCASGALVDRRADAAAATRFPSLSPRTAQPSCFN